MKKLLRSRVPHCDMFLLVVSWPDPSSAVLVKGRSPAGGHGRPFTSDAEEGRC